MVFRIPKRCKRRHAFCLCIALFLSGLTPALAQQQVSVVDGYDAQSFSRNNFPSFHPNASNVNAWQVRYLSGRHLRTFARAKTFYAQTFANVVPEVGLFVRYIDFPNTGHAVPWLAFFDVDKVVLKSFTNPYLDKNDLPEITSIAFDAIANPGVNPRNIEWVAAYRTAGSQTSKLVYYTFQDPVWQADTIDVFQGAVRSVNSLRFLNHGQGRKSVAVATDSLFHVTFWDGTRWLPLQTALNERYAALLEGATLADGTPVWQYNQHLFSLKNDSLTVEKVPLDSTLRFFTNQRFFVTPEGDKHLLFRTQKPDFSYDFRYLLFRDGNWSTEILPFDLPSRDNAAVWLVEDTVVVALHDALDQRLTILRRMPDGMWSPESEDIVGDTGIELSIDTNPVDPNNTAIAYYDRDNGDLKVASGMTLYGEVPFAVQRVDSPGDVGRFPKVAWNADRLDVVYYDATQQRLRHAAQVPFSVYPEQWGPWQIQTIDTLVSVVLPFGLLKNDDQTLEIAYADSLSDSIKVAVSAGESWQTENAVQATVDAPGEVSIFRAADSLFVAYVDDARLFLATRQAPGSWATEAVPTDFDVAYALACADFSQNIHVVYRARQGFHDQIRHVWGGPGNWSESTVVTTLNNGNYLKLRPATRFGLTLILAFVDDSRAQTYCYGGHDWSLIMQGTRFMSDSMVDFSFTDFYTLTLYYRALGDGSGFYGYASAPELVADVVVEIVDSVTGAAAQKPEFALAQFPNPFNAETTFEYSLPVQGKVRIEIYDILGRKIQTLVDAEQPAGQYRISYSARALASGIYFYHYAIAGKTGTRKMLLIK